jgi:hypothetical protein
MGKIIWLAGIICAVWVIYDVWSKNTRLSETNKIIWTVFAILFSILTAIVYYVTQKMNNSY